MDTILWNEESDRYTERILKSIDSKVYSTSKNEYAKKIFNLSKKYLKKITNILDIGCSYGSLLKALSKYLKNKNLFGIDPGQKTIKLAKEINQKKSNLHFKIGYSHDLSFKDNFFDIIILSMVLQWIPRKYIIMTISEIDRILNENGIIFLIDFLPNRPITSQSIHNNKVYIFKDDYEKYFTVFPNYFVVYREVMNIDKGENQQRFLSVIKKYPISEVFLLKKGVQEKK